MGHAPAMPQQRQSSSWIWLTLLSLILLCGTSVHYRSISAFATTNQASEYASSLIDAVMAPFSDGHDKIQKVPSNTTAALKHKDEDYLAICITARDQGAALPEFLQHHYHNMGIKHFYIMDDSSIPPLSTMAGSYGVPQESLTFVYFANDGPAGAMRGNMYYQCASIYGKKHAWMAFIDSNDFIDTPGHESVQQILRGVDETLHEDVGALAMQWRIHTPTSEPARSVLGSSDECTYDDPQHAGRDSENRYVKQIVKVYAYASYRDAHHIRLRDGMVTVGEHADLVEGGTRLPISRDRIALHHYPRQRMSSWHDEEMRAESVEGDEEEEEEGPAVADLIEGSPRVECSEMVRWAE